MNASELAQAIRGRERSAAEVVDAHLRRIEAVNPRVNAVVQVDGERALAQAREADAALARGEAIGPLHGVPFTVKDNLEAAGIEMTIGAPERRGVVAERDAVVVARMRAAGAILLGKTNCPAYGGGIETDNEVYGRTNNPYDLERTPGGSSGGEAAAIAAGCSPCGFGTDSGASVRLPAHFCGLAALKPTAGRVPADRRARRPRPDRRAVRPAHAGRHPRPLGRRRRAAARRRDRRAGGSLPDVRRPRVAVHTDNGLHTPTPETVAAVEAAADGARRRASRPRCTRAAATS